MQQDPRVQLCLSQEGAWNPVGEWGWCGSPGSAWESGGERGRPGTSWEPGGRCGRPEIVGERGLRGSPETAWEPGTAWESGDGVGDQRLGARDRLGVGAGRLGPGERCPERHAAHAPPAPSPP